MPRFFDPRRHPRTALASLLVLTVGLTAFASAQLVGAKPPARHFEYVHQEVESNAVTQTMNDLDGQGWEIFQVMPTWQVKNEDAVAVLSPKSYQVFGRRAIVAR